MTTNIPQLTKPDGIAMTRVSPNSAKEEEDEKIRDCFNGFVCF